MTCMFSNSGHVADSFWQVRRAALLTVVHLGSLGTAVGSGTSQSGHGDSFDGGVERVIQQITSAEEAGARCRQGLLFDRGSH